MAEYSAPATLTTPGGTILFNRPASDVGFHDPSECSGLEGAPVRTVISDKARTSGANVYDALFSGREIVLAGWIRSSTVAGREAFINSLIAAINSLMTANGTYAWDAYNGTHTVTVRFLMPAVAPGRWIKKYQFALIAADPTIS